MNKNKATYQFDGDWEFNLRLPKLSQIYDEIWFGKGIRTPLLDTLEQGYVPFQIFDERTYDPDPTDAQNNAIHYLVKNENVLLQSLFSIFKNQINPKFVEWCGEDEWIPELHSHHDFGKLARINNIQVLTHHKSNVAYLRIDFEYKGDEEHGIAIVLHQDQLIGFAGIGDMGYECIYQDMGFDQKKVYEGILEKRKFGINMVHTPLEKYGKHKPWQLEATSDYFDKLFREKNNQKIIEEIQSNQWNINIRFPELNKNLVDKAAYFNNVELLEYLIDQGGDFSQTLSQGVNHHEASLRILVKKGASIDTYGFRGKTLLCFALENFVRALVQKEQYKSKDEARYEKKQKEFETLKKRVLLYMELGANPNNLEQKGKTYQDVVNNSWAKHIIKQYKIMNQVETLIFPKRVKKFNWKFWK